MFKRILVAAAIMVASPAIVSAQDIFWSFSSTSAVNSIAPTGTVSGTAYIFSDGLFGFDAIDLNLTTSDPNALQFTGGTAINSTFNIIGATRFDGASITADGTGDANFFAVNVVQNGVNPALGPLFDPDFVLGIGPNGAALLAEVNYNFTNSLGGPVTLGFALGTNGAIQLPNTPLNPSFGTAIISIPEPSSIALLVLGSVGLVSRRKRS